MTAGQGRSCGPTTLAGSLAAGPQAGPIPQKGEHTAMSTRTTDHQLTVDEKGPGALIAAEGVVLVLAFGLLVAPVPEWTAREMTVLEWISAHHSAVGDLIATLVSQVFSPIGAPIVLLGLGAAIAARRGMRRSLVLVIVTAVTWLSSWGVKMLVHRARPDGGLLVTKPPVETSFAYPTGHTVFATVIVIAAAIALGPRHRAWSTPAAIALVLATAASRVYLGVHYPSDVIAGVVFGASTFTLLYAVARTPPGRHLLTHRPPAEPEGTPPARHA